MVCRFGPQCRGITGPRPSRRYAVAVRQSSGQVGVLYGLTFRQPAILAVAAIGLYGAWSALHTLVPVAVLVEAGCGCCPPNMRQRGVVLRIDTAPVIQHRGRVPPQRLL